MNERIQSLVEQATTKEDTYPAGCNGHPVPVYYFDKEKFAELILEECTDIVYNLLEENTGAEVVVRIKEHFGLEK